MQADRVTDAFLTKAINVSTANIPKCDQEMPHPLHHYTHYTTTPKKKYRKDRGKKERVEEGKTEFWATPAAPHLAQEI